MRSAVVERTRLIERLERIANRPLLLVSAPAGFGKTTLLSSWLRRREWHSCWVALDTADNDVVRFWSYIIAALRTIEPTIGGAAQALLQASPPELEPALTSLINELTCIDVPVTLLLDDYHLITTEQIHASLTFLIDHQPPQLRLVICSRAAPPLPLARLRARGQLAELGAADLRFLPVEATAFLNDVMGLQLSTEHVSALEARTEGWAAGLQLAALSLQTHADPAAFLADFTGSHRYILDYLAEEVLLQQSPDVQQFLLQTALLERMSGPLADAVTSRLDSQMMLERLERVNLFVVPLDEQRRWYRYHHLFGEFLRNRLQQSSPATVAVIHERAATWYEQNGFLSEAIDHALAARDWERAADIIERMVDELHMRGEHQTLQHWLNQLPETLITSRPPLCLVRAWMLMFDNHPDDVVERWLQRAEALVAAQVGTPEHQLVMVQTAIIRTFMANSHNDVPNTIAFAQQALAQLPADDVQWRGLVNLSLGVAAWMSDDTDTTLHYFQEAVATARAAGNVQVTTMALRGTADIHTIRGQLRAGWALYQQAIQYALEQHAPQLMDVSRAYYSLGRICYEWNDLAMALDYTHESIAQAPSNPDPSSYMLLGRIFAAQGEPRQAEQALEDAAQLATKHNYPPFVSYLAARRARIACERGDLAAVQHWVETCGLCPDDQTKHLLEYEYITLGLILSVLGRSADALPLLQGLVKAAEGSNRQDSLIKILPVQAIVQQAHGNSLAAQQTLQRALELAEAEGYVRTFIDLGLPMAQLLNQCLMHRYVSTYAAKLLAAMPTHVQIELTANQRGIPSANDPATLVEPLSERELQVLQMVVDGHSNTAIARKLVVAVSTVKTHINNIYGKLGVGSRVEAVARANELGLVPRRS